MPKFKYLASDAQGREKAGMLESANKGAALAQLKEWGMFPSSVEEVSAKAARRAAPVPPPGSAVPKKTGLSREIAIPLPKFLRRKRIKKKQLMVLSRQLATLYDAGVPLLRALQILHKQERATVVKDMLYELCESVEGGSTFAEALAQHPKMFDKLFINMVKAGEIGGVLAVTLNRLAEFIEKAEKIKTRVKGAMIYPIVVLFIACIITGFLMVFVIPKFTDIFKDLLGGAELPVLTQFVIKVSQLVTQRAPAVIGAIIAVVILFKLIVRTRNGRYVFDALKLKMPVFGNLVLRVSISRFTRTLGTLLTSGVQILQALTIVRDTAGNEVVAKAIQSVHDSVKEGEPVATPLETAGVFPPMVVSMITVGEETGKLPEMLVKIADNYDTEVDAAVDGLTSIIEPILIIFLAVVVGTIVVAMFMPLIKIVTTLQV